MNLSIVVPVLNNWWLTRRLLRRVDSLRASFPLEMIVVDNGSSDGTPAGLREFPWVRAVRFEENRNFAGGCNAGAAVASGDVILFLNNDAVPIGNPFSAMLAAFRDERIAIAAGTLFYEDGPIQMAGAVIEREGGWTALLANAAHEFVSYDGAGERFPTGAAVAVRATWFHGAGGYDEAYRNGKEDDDLVMRARTDGMRCVVLPDAQFTHYDGATQGRNRYDVENDARFRSRWKQALAAMPRVSHPVLGAMLLSDNSRTALETQTIRALEESITRRGNPVIRTWYPWLALDTRFRSGSMIAFNWCGEDERRPSVNVVCGERGMAEIRTHGDVEMTIPFNPCIPDSLRSSIHFDAAGPVAVIARDPALLTAMREALSSLGRDVVALGPADVWSERQAFSCAVVDGVLDPFAAANGAISRAGIPCLALADGDIASVMDDDVVPRLARSSLESGVRAWLSRSDALAAIAADARNDVARRFTLSRCARRLIQAASYARAGFPRPMASRNV